MNNEQFIDLVQRELDSEISEQEKTFLWSSLILVKRWETTLKALKAMLNRQVKEQEEYIQQKRRMYLAPSSLRSKKEEVELQRNWAVIETKEQEKVLRLKRDLEAISIRILTINTWMKEEHIKKEAHALARKERRMQYLEDIQERQRDQGYAAKYRQGYKKGIGQMYALILDGYSPEDAYRYCQHYVQEELLDWVESYHLDDSQQPPAFPIEVQDRKEIH